MDQEKIGRFIAERRKDKNMTQEQMAEKLGVSSKSISRWENGKTMPDVSLFEALCEELNITVNELLKGEKITAKNKSINLSVMSLLPMLMNQYGGLKGVQEITGLINLLNPIGIISVALFLLGVWLPFKKDIIGKILGGIGVIGIVLSEIYKFFTWHIMNITGEMSLENSIEFAFPEFYIGMGISLIMVVIYFSIDKIIKE